MELHSLLTHLSDRGIKLSAEGDSLLIDAPKGSIVPELRDSLIEHKAELLLLLHQNSETASSGRLPQIESDPAHRYEPFPLTEMQRAFWVGRSGVLELGTVANHGYYEIDCKDLALERLNQALHQLIDRHDMLRAIVLPDGQQQILQQVPPYEIQVFDLRGQKREAIEAHLETIRQRLSHQVLPTDRFPLFEFCATLLDEVRTRLHISYDLQIFDAWSLFRLFDEWFQLYQQPNIQLPPLEISFRDYAIAERKLPQTELYRRSQAYWFNRLDRLPPAPDLPLAKQPKELKQHLCKRYDRQLSRDIWQQLKQRAAQAGLTPSGVLLAAFAEVLSQWSKVPQFTLNLASFNRLPLHPQVNDLLGDFTSVILLAVDYTAKESFVDRAKRLQQQLWQDLEHRYVSGVEVTRELSRRRGMPPSAMPVVFTSTLGFGVLGQETLTFSHFGELVYGISQASQTWMDVQVWEDKGRLTCNWDVVEELFPDGLIQDMVEAYWQLLQQLATSEAAWLETTRSLIPPAQLAQRKATETAPIPDALLHSLFAAQVEANRDRWAIVTARERLTYQEVYRRSNQIGHCLRERGVRPNRLVAVVMEKGWEQAIAVLGILAAGAAYVPIDPSLPPARLADLVNHSDAEIVLTQSWLDRRLKWTIAAQRLCVDTDFCNESCEPLLPVQTLDDLAYVIYTSGSTGQPKGVAIAHRGVVNAIAHTNQQFQVSAGDRVLALTALHHDMSVYDIFGVLAAGGTLIVPDASMSRDPAHWMALMQQERVTLWNSVPAMMEMLLAYAESNSSVQLPDLRWTFLGGDWISLTLPDRLKALAPNAQLVSVGGPTETTLWNIWHVVDRIDSHWKSIPYGRPIANTKYYVLNESLIDCPTWVPGELCCAGVGLAKGYWRDPEKTRDRFITHPQTGERIYRTGDLGRYRADGTLEILGRVDFQVKIRGQRIETGEIEAALQQHLAVRGAIVTAIEPQTDKARLVGFVVPDRQKPSPETLRQFLNARLPAHMVPTLFVILKTFPLSANGKVDRRTLMAQAIALPMPETAYIAPQNQLEQTIAAVWQEILHLDRIGVRDNFFDIGGNSLLVTKAYSKLKIALPDDVKSWALTDLFKYPTIHSFAAYLHPDPLSSPHPSEELAQKLQDGKTRLKQQLSRAIAIRQ
ncbi:non-ribosomal peptide synthetase [Chroococcidiopsis sp. CCNUC1]|uniref:non-ribosomal peptide synthetase n=1 Tax=Chroococcidiopsis sp. CCNUC1 TaxID=2653189 RepID=UPI000D0660CA|nr:non-ribosomal peptide synthetase [Chroococcidiopsis sp. CCNUC1]PSB49524.1 non-ribosomal peptide synthetase [Cyanosarcina cf. burmensis CCALA 770]URD53868.1 non-ribosomal peptide synthetase [Chroococcidiopsis sp. CCNUC1]